MLVIALDTSTPAVTAGLVRVLDHEVEVLAQRTTVNPRAHGELLTPHLMDAVAEAGVALTDADAIVCGAGPGPFTGLRVGMVTAASLSHALAIPVYPVCGLDAIAYAAPTDDELLVLTDARRKEVYWARYEARTSRRTRGPEVCRPEQLTALIAESRISAAAGEKARSNQDTLGISAVEPETPSVRGLVAVAENELRNATSPQPLVPYYLRHPDAETPGAPKPVSTGIFR